MKLVQQGLHVGCMEERFVMCLVVNLSPEALWKRKICFGAPGVRCKPHMKLQVPSFGPKRCRDPFSNLPELPEKERCCYANGSHWRCKRQRKDVTSKYCEHHEDLYQKRLHRMWLQRLAKGRKRKGCRGEWQSNLQNAMSQRSPEARKREKVAEKALPVSPFHLI